MITAHAGALGTRANSLESLKTCVDFFGASGCIEVDVRFNGAGVPVLTHNAPIFGENTLELSRLFELIKGTNITLNLDLKERSNLGEIQRLGKVFSVLPQLFFTGVKFHQVKPCIDNAPLIPYYINQERLKLIKYSPVKIQKLAEKIKEAGGIGLNTSHRNASGKMAQILHENALLLSVFTVDKKKYMHRAIAQKADNITTRRPEVLRELLA